MAVWVVSKLHSDLLTSVSFSSLQVYKFYMFFTNYAFIVETLFLNQLHNFSYDLMLVLKLTQNTCLS